MIYSAASKWWSWFSVDQNRYILLFWIRLKLIQNWSATYLWRFWPLYFKSLKNRFWSPRWLYFLLRFFKIIRICLAISDFLYSLGPIWRHCFENWRDLVTICTIKVILDKIYLFFIHFLRYFVLFCQNRLRGPRIWNFLPYFHISLQKSWISVKSKFSFWTFAEIS